MSQRYPRDIAELTYEYINLLLKNAPDLGSKTLASLREELFKDYTPEVKNDRIKKIQEVNDLYSMTLGDYLKRLKKDIDASQS